MKKTIFFLMLIYFALNAYNHSSAQDPTQWSKTRQTFMEKRNNSNPDYREKVAKQLGEAMYPAVESEAASLLVEHIKSEIKRAKGALDKEQQVKYGVIKACVSGLEKVKEQKAIDYLLKVAEDSKTEWRVRFHIIQALGNIDNLRIKGMMIKFIDDSHPPIRYIAFEALARYGIPDAIERTYKLLNENIGWEVKIAAIGYLEKMQNKDMIEPLINVMQDETFEGSVRLRIVDLLKTLTGVDCGVSGIWWQDWWRKKKEREDPDYKPDEGATQPVIPTLYYGITVTSGRIIFILDISDSMTQAAHYTDYSKHDDSKDPCNKVTTGPDEPKKEEVEAIKKLKELKNKSDNKTVVNRFDAALKELINTIYYLDPSVEFTVIFFDVAQRQWKDTLMPATVENKISVLEYISQKIGIGAGTGFYDALELAYKFIGKEKEGEAPKSGYEQPETAKKKIRTVQLDRKCNYLEEYGGADTFFMVTDGAPTYGKIIIKDDILDEIEKINQFRNVKINVVAIGEPPLNPLQINPRMDVDVKFLGKLADITGGVFRDKTSKVKPGSEKK